MSVRLTSVAGGTTVLIAQVRAGLTLLNVDEGY